MPKTHNKQQLAKDLFESPALKSLLELSVEAWASHLDQLEHEELELLNLIVQEEKEIHGFIHEKRRKRHNANLKSPALKVDQNLPLTHEERRNKIAMERDHMKAHLHEKFRIEEEALRELVLAEKRLAGLFTRAFESMSALNFNLELA